MQFLLDTNAVIALIGGKAAVLTERVLACNEGDIGLPSIVVSELYFGAYKSSRIAQNLETLRLLFEDLAVLEFSREDARTAGEVRADLALRGTPIGPYDALIAGQAKARALTLITNNVREFGRVAGLRVQDWTQP